MKYKLINSVSKKETICDKVVVDGFDYYVSDEKVHFGYVWNTILEQIETMFKEKKFHDDLKGIIATTNHSLMCPKVVDHIHKLACDTASSSLNTESNEIIGITAFYEGYSQSQETHPFSEEDMIEFGKFCHNDAHSAVNKVKTFKELLQLWREQKPKIVYYE